MKKYLPAFSISIFLTGLTVNTLTPTLLITWPMFLLLLPFLSYYKGLLLHKTAKIDKKRAFQLALKATSYSTFIGIPIGWLCYFGFSLIVIGILNLSSDPFAINLSVESPRLNAILQYAIESLLLAAKWISFAPILYFGHHGNIFFMSVSMQSLLLCIPFYYLFIKLDTEYILTNTEPNEVENASIIIQDINKRCFLIIAAILICIYLYFALH